MITYDQAVFEKIVEKLTSHILAKGVYTAERALERARKDLQLALEIAVGRNNFDSYFKTLQVSKEELKDLRVVWTPDL